MSITRTTMITSMQSALETEEDVLAIWLEGADASGNVDRFSDIDICCSVKQ